MTEPLLSVDGLNVHFKVGIRQIHAVRDVSFSLGTERLAIVGESGSGKSTVGRALVRLLPRIATITARRMDLSGQPLNDFSEAEMRKVRGRQVSMIMQDPKYSLNPVTRIGDQVAEAYLVHHKSSRREARERALEQLAAVQINDPEHVYRLYPHEVSGGMGQRIMIAMMLIPEPNLIIADEPTSALDATVRLQVLRILDDLVIERGIGLIFISHDLNLVESFCDRALVMYSGQVVEDLKPREFEHARHAYSRGLRASVPRIGRRLDRLPVLDRKPEWSLPVTGQGNT